MEAEGAALSFLTPRDQEVYRQLRADFPGLEDPEWAPDPQWHDQLTQPLPKEEKREDALRAEKMKLCVFAGKSRKLRPGDLVGAICGIDGVTAEDIGVIDIQEHHAFVEILPWQRRSCPAGAAGAHHQESKDQGGRSQIITARKTRAMFSY